MREGFHGRVGLGDRCALLVIDMILGFTDPSSPLGSDLTGVAHSVGRLVTIARRFERPLVYTTIAYRSAVALDPSPSFSKVPALRTLEHGSKWVEIDPVVGARDDDVVLEKLGFSAFSGTPLIGLLNGWNIESVIVCGASTSGCVRATVVDALQLGYRPTVVTDAVGDRDAAAHAASLHDIEMKYGDLLTVDEIEAHLRSQTPSLGQR